MNEVKTGWRTSEFWTVLLTQLIGFLVLLGIVSVQDQGTLVDSLTKMVSSLGAVLANAAVVVKYIQSRTELKSLSVSDEEE